MSDARLATSVEVSALLARASAVGGFGAVLRRGDAERGGLLVLVGGRGIVEWRLERMLQANGTYDWERRDAGDAAVLAGHVSRATDRDPDLWVIELDVPSPERFVAEMT